MPTQSMDPDKDEALEAEAEALSDALAIVKRTRLYRAAVLRDRLAKLERKDSPLGTTDWFRKAVAFDAELGAAEQILERLKPPREPWDPTMYDPTADPTADPTPNLPDD